MPAKAAKKTATKTKSKTKKVVDLKNRKGYITVSQVLEALAVCDDWQQWGKKFGTDAASAIKAVVAGRGPAGWDKKRVLRSVGEKLGLLDHDETCENCGGITPEQIDTNVRKALTYARIHAAVAAYLKDQRPPSRLKLAS